MPRRSVEEYPAQLGTENIDHVSLELILEGHRVIIIAEQRAGDHHGDAEPHRAGHARHGGHHAHDTGELVPRFAAGLRRLTLEGLMDVTDDTVKHVDVVLAEHESDLGEVVLQHRRPRAVGIVEMGFPCQIVGRVDRLRHVLPRLARHAIGGQRRHLTVPDFGAMERPRNLFHDLGAERSVFHAGFTDAGKVVALRPVDQSGFVECLHGPLLIAGEPVADYAAAAGD